MINPGYSFISLLIRIRKVIRKCHAGTVCVGCVRMSEEDKSVDVKGEEEKKNTAVDDDKPAVDGAPLVKILEKDELKTAEEDEEVIVKE